MSIESRVIEYDCDGLTLEGFYAHPKGQTRPGVLIVHEWWGHNDYVRERATMLADEGYAAFALDMYGKEKVTENPKRAGLYMHEAFNEAEVAEKRFKAATDTFAQQDEVDADQISAIGYCFGGSVVLHMARIGLHLRAVASFHAGSLQPKAPAQKGVIAAKVLVASGADDPMNPPEDVEAFKAEMAEAGVAYEYIGYPGVVHGFTNKAATARGEKYGLPLAYNEDADKDSWKRLLKLLSSL